MAQSQGASQCGLCSSTLLVNEPNSRKSVPPAGWQQRGPLRAPPAGPSHHPGGGGGRGFAAISFGFANAGHSSGPLYWYLADWCTTTAAGAIRKVQPHLGFSVFEYYYNNNNFTFLIHIRMPVYDELQRWNSFMLHMVDDHIDWS